jgi:hypothetical protein
LPTLLLLLLSCSVLLMGTACNRRARKPKDLQLLATQQVRHFVQVTNTGAASRRDRLDTPAGYQQCMHFS